MRRRSTFVKKLAAVLSIWAIAAPMAMFQAATATPAKGLTEEQKILHVLNRLGFGARPGDVERVKRIGLDKYIDQQLNPGSIDDSSTEAKVKNLDVFNLSTSEIFAKYPNPGALLQRLNGEKRPQQNAAANLQQNAVGQQPMPPGAGQNAGQDDQKDQKERQAMLRELYAKYDLKPAAQLLPQIVANRVIRDVYSERQLQEVMVDFWQNHFNVFSGKAAVRLSVVIAIARIAPLWRCGSSGGGGL